MTLGDWLQVIMAIIGAFAAIFSWKSARAAALAALAAEKQVDQMEKTRRHEARPIMTIKEAQRVDQPEGKRFPMLLFFENQGKGPGNVLVVECDRTDVGIHVGTPINVGSGGTTHVEIWLPSPNKQESIHLSLCYWDVEGQMYVTESYVHLNWTHDKSQWLFIDIDRQAVGSKKRPGKVVNWPLGGREYFYKLWWSKENAHDFVSRTP